MSSRLLLAFAAYLLLLGGVVGSTMWVLDKQHDDGLVVNLSGRQRMLTQRMTHQLMTYADQVRRGVDTQEARTRVLGTIRTFEVTLDALERGGPAPLDLNATQMRELPAGSPAVVAQIERVRDVYEGYRRAADVILDGAPTAADAPGVDAASAQVDAASAVRGAAVEHIIEHNTELLSEMNAVVFLMQDEAEAKVAMLYRIQTAAVVAALLLTLGLFVLVKGSITTPLEELRRASEELSLGNLHCVIPVEGPQEIRNLAGSVERLRMSLHATLGNAPPAGALDEFARL